MAFAMLAMAYPALTQTAIDTAQAGADFGIQGEYLGGGETGDGPLGVQVIAMGAGSFKAVFLLGGLPGQGWNGRDRFEAAGTLVGGAASFSGQGYAATIATGSKAMQGKTPQGADFVVDKVMRKSPTEGSAPPQGALVLFAGDGLSAWMDGTAIMDARNLLKPANVSSSGGALTKSAFQSFHLHAEFRLPFMPGASGTARGNSGIYLQSRYELQILDSFGASLSPLPDSMTPKRVGGAFWEQTAPSLNMSYPPLSWQTYDIDFTAAVFDAAGTRIAPAVVTVRWNGEIVHDGLRMLNRTLAGQLEGPDPRPLLIQDHGDPVYYRNIWIVQGATSIKPKGGKPSRHGSVGQDSRSLLFVSADGRITPGAPDGESARPARRFYLPASPNARTSHPHSGEKP